MVNLRFAILLGWRLACVNLAIAQPLPVHFPVPGGIAVVDLGEANSPRPKVTLASRQVLVIENEGHWTAVVGIPLAFGPGRHEVKVSIRLPKGKERYVIPPSEDLNRIVRERHLPVQGRIGSSFGLHRFFNSEPRSPHLGLDLSPHKERRSKLLRRAPCWSPRIFLHRQGSIFGPRPGIDQRLFPP